MLSYIDGGVCAPQGFKAGGVASGIKKNGDADLACIISDKKCATAACYTTNKVKAAPIYLTQKHIKRGEARAILCNSGNANTCNPEGMQAAERCCHLLAESASIQPEEVVVASTGVIGQALPLEPFKKGIPTLVDQLSYDGGTSAAQAIMTTDTVEKELAAEFVLDEQPCRVGMMSKGSGMINPNMATLLVFITTDVDIDAALLKMALDHATRRSFNQISVDGDTSTNDMVAVLANGTAKNRRIAQDSTAFHIFQNALTKMCIQMSQMLAADGEGATKLIECRVSGAPDEVLARRIAKSVVSSDLVKTAMFGEDANWGRVLCAIGYTEGDFNAENISLVIKSKAGSVLVCQQSAHHPFNEEKAAEILAEDKIELLIDLHNGYSLGMAWGCDLTYDYVKINGDYRT